MSKESICNIFNYLTSLAPRFFAEHMEGATEQEISRLETAAGTNLSYSHREFLRIAGNTPAQALNPFLNDRDYCITTLLNEYSYLQEVKEKIPKGIVFFSSSKILGENIFLRHGKTLQDEPDVGDIDFNNEKFICRDVKPFDHWLSSSVFFFRIGQFKHKLRLQIKLASANSSLELQTCINTLVNMGCRRVFSLYSGTQCLDRGDLAVTIYADGSGKLASNNLWLLQEAQNKLNEQSDISFKLIPEKYQIYSPCA